MKFKMISVKRHASTPCIPLTPKFVTSVFKSWSKLDALVSEITVKGDNGKIILRPNQKMDKETEAMIEAYQTLSDIVETFESDCEPEN